MSRAILVTGGGGVGKTTISAALGVAAARAGLRTLVVTVDPAKRLADALGVEDLGSEPTPNDSVENLWAAMLDATSSWNSIARRHAPPDVAERLVENEFFKAISRQFPASQAYAAAEEMANFLDAKVWDLVIVDTPPSSGGIEFFSAPKDMRDFVGGRLLRWLTGARLPGRKLVFNVTGKPALRIAGSVLGTDLLERVVDFLMDLRTTYDGLAGRAKQIERHFRAATLIVVTTSDPAPLREAGRFFRELPKAAPSPSVVVFNRVLPTDWGQAGNLRASKATASSDNLGRVETRTLERNLERWAADAAHQAEVRDSFARGYEVPLATIAWQTTAPTDLDSLAALVDTAGGFDLTGLL